MVYYITGFIKKIHYTILNHLKYRANKYFYLYKKMLEYRFVKNQ